MATPDSRCEVSVRIYAVWRERLSNLIMLISLFYILILFRGFYPFGYANRIVTILIKMFTVVF